MKNIDIIPRLNLEKGDAILLFGSMGAGKTYFTSHLCHKLNCQEKACSPTYTITNHYFFPHGYVVHSDLYRITAIDEFLMQEIYSNDAINIIEWAEKLDKNALLCMPNRLHLHFQTDTYLITKIEQFGRFVKENFTI